MGLNTEGQHAGQFIVSEAVGDRSRETIILLSGENLVAGMVLGEITKSGSATSAVDADNTGDGVMGAVTVAAGAKVGVYNLLITAAATNAGEFTVEDPDGITVDTGDVAAAFSAGGIAFTLADGAADFVVGDRFTITVVAGSGKFKEHDLANVDGSEVPVAILFDNVDASAADKNAVVMRRDCVINVNEISWFSGATAGNKTAGLASLALKGIIGRE